MGPRGQDARQRIAGMSTPLGLRPACRTNCGCAAAAIARWALRLACTPKYHWGWLVLLPPPCSRLAPTHDCNSEQAQRMARLLGGRAVQLELILHQHLPIFHTGRLGAPAAPGCAGASQCSEFSVVVEQRCAHGSTCADGCMQVAATGWPCAAPAARHAPVARPPSVFAEHCVFCRFLSDGNDFRDCGHPCEKSVVHLRDDKGAAAARSGAAGGGGGGNGAAAPGGGLPCPSCSRGRAGAEVQIQQASLVKIQSTAVMLPTQAAPPQRLQLLPAPLAPAPLAPTSSCCPPQAKTTWC